MEFKQKISDYSLRHYRSVTIVMVVATLALGALIPLIKVDTDPENRLSEPVKELRSGTYAYRSLVAESNGRRRPSIFAPCTAPLGC